MDASFSICSLSARSRDSIRVHFAGLSPEDRILRFGYQPGEAVIDEYVARIDFASALLFGACDARRCMAALLELRPRGRDYELGLSIWPDARGQGIGSRLLELALQHARDRGARRVIMYCQAGNQRMMRLGRRMGARFHCAGSEAVGIIRVDGSARVPVLAHAS